MTTLLKVTDIARTAKLLKQLVKASDVNQDGAVRWREALWGVDPQKGEGISLKKKRNVRIQPNQAVHSMVRFAQGTGTKEIPEINKAIDELARRVKAGDKDQDGFISENEASKLSTGGESAFVQFGHSYAKSKLSDFVLPQTHKGSLPPFRYSGTIKEVTTSLLNAYSTRANDNFGAGSPSRYVISAPEAKAMVKALEALYPARQAAVLKELSKRTQKSFVGCVGVMAGAKTVFEKYAASLDLPSLTFKNPKAPPSPPH